MNCIVIYVLLFCIFSNVLTGPTSKKIDNAKEEDTKVLNTYSKLAPRTEVPVRLDNEPSVFDDCTISLHNNTKSELGLSINDDHSIDDQLGVSLMSATPENSKVSNDDYCLGISLMDSSFTEDDSSIKLGISLISDENSRNLNLSETETKTTQTTVGKPFFLTSTPNKRRSEFKPFHFSSDDDEKSDISEIQCNYSPFSSSSVADDSFKIQDNIEETMLNSNTTHQLTVVEEYQEQDSESSDGLANIYHDVKASFPDEVIKPLLDSHRFPEKNRLLHRHTKIINIQRDLKLCHDCCEKVCPNKLTLLQIKNMRLDFWSKSLNGRTQWLMNKFIETGEKKSPYFCIVDGTMVCRKALIKIFGLDKNFYYRVRQKYVTGARFSVKESPTNNGIRLLNAINWLEDYSTFYVDRMPDSNFLLLPYRTKQCSIYLRYKEDMLERSEGYLMPSAFYKMWKKHFPNLKVKKTNSFSKCTVCTSLERQIEQAHNPGLREKLRIERRQHNKNQMLERKYYYAKKNAAKVSPSQYLSLIVDGMDQSKTNLPHFVGRLAKAVSPVDQLATHVTGILAHGQNKFFTFLDWNQYPHDSNLTMNVLLIILYEISKLMGDKLPAILYLQADNCWRENKNRYVLAFCELLVHQRIFNEVHLSFLPVGHTHEDVDAAFSRIAEKLRRQDAETMQRLKSMLPNNRDIEALYDIRAWLTPYLNNIQKHTGPLHYKFSRDTVSGHVTMQYKQFHDSNWKTETIGMFNKLSEKIYNLPKGIPTVLNPQFDKINIDKIRSRLPHWQCLFSDQVEHSEKSWWTNFLHFLDKIKNNNAFRQTHIISKAKWYLHMLPRQTENKRNEDAEQEIPREIQRLLDNERQESEVQIRPIAIASKARKQTSSRGNGRNVVKPKARKTDKQSKRTIYCSYVYFSYFRHDYRKFNMFFLIFILLESLSMFTYIMVEFYTYQITLVVMLSIWNAIINQHIGNTNTKASRHWYIQPIRVL